MVSRVSIEEEKRLIALKQSFPVLTVVDAAVRKQGGTILLVGGAVRNVILGIPVTDVDVEVYGLSLSQLQVLLARHGRVDYVGKSFGVLRIASIAIDWALPRKDQSGRHPQVELIPDLSVEEALRRRDITMNAMAIDLQTHELFDPFGGREDMKAGRLRTPDPAFFIQDPLRFYRVMQFIGRFQMRPDDELNRLCKIIDLSGVSHDRIVVECDKLMLLSSAPSQGLRWLADIERLGDIFPELATTIGILQDISWHPEGDVFEHTMQALDAAAQQKYPLGIDRRTIIYATLCHDLGKALATKIQDGKIRSIGHDEVGVRPTQLLMQRMTRERKLQHIVSLLVRHHMAPGNFIKQNAGLGAYKRLAYLLAPFTTLHALAYVAYADKRGRNPARGKPLEGPLPDIDLFIQRAREAGVLDAPEAPILSGADVAPYVVPGPKMGEFLDRAYEIQINKGIIDKDELIKRVMDSIL